jgi:hypothetical protein
MTMRIYTVRNKATGKLVRHVRAHSLNSAIRAVAAENFTAEASSTEDIFQAAKSGNFDVLDAVAPEQVDIEDPREVANPETNSASLAARNSRSPVDA